MHRSGTSAVAGLLHTSGISMGFTFRKPLEQNPKGFFEEELFRQFNDILLNKVGYNVKEWRTDYSGVVADYLEITTGIKIIKSFDHNIRSWGWKDPRTCLTIDVWLKVLRSCGMLQYTNIIIVNRSIKAVSKSLFIRGNIVDLNEGEKLYKMYHQHINIGLSNYRNKINILTISYENLIKGNDFNRLESFCDVKLDKNFIDTSLNHGD